MFIAALEQLLEWDPANIQTYGYALTLDLIEDLRNRGFLVTEDGWRGGHLFGVRLPPDVNLTALQARLQEHQVYVSLRGSAIRVSVHVYNDATDVEALGQALLG
jgi:selenocysteine lyase/cysteine desulfurase